MKIKFGLIFKCICVVASLVVISSTEAASIKTEMENLFNNNGSMSNSTAPNVYQTQSSNIATLGSFQTRVPVQNTPLFTYSLPTVKAGCGGVDARLGGFSWIDDDAFKGMLQAIGNNTKGILFMLAIKGVSSLIGSNIEMLLKNLQDATNFFSNSCRNAEMLIDGFSGKKTADLYSACMKIRRLAGDDEPQAQRACQNDAPSVNANAASSGDEATKTAAQKDINLVWAALKKTDLDHDEKEMYMNLSGTVIVRAAGQNNETIGPTITDLETLEHGNSDVPPGSNEGDVGIAGWKTCDENTDPECLNPKTLAVKAITPFTQLVTNRLYSLKKALHDNQTPSASDINFVNHSSLPIAQMLRIGYMSGRDQITDSFINRYARVIGYDFAYNFLNKGLRESSVFLRNGANRRGVEDDSVKDLLDSIENLTKHLDAGRNTAAAEQQAMNSMLTNLQQVEQQLYATLPNGVQNMLSFAGQLGNFHGR